MRRVAVALLLTIGLPALLLLARCASGRAHAPAAGTGPPAGATGTPAASPAPAPTPAPAETVTPPGSTAASDRIDFASRIVPLLQERCSPCHFPGGRMYERLPFDQETTIRVLGTKLFTRLREPEDQELVGAFLEQQQKPAR